MWTRRQTALLIRPIVFCQEERERGGERERRERRGEERGGEGLFACRGDIRGCLCLVVLTLVSLALQCEIHKSSKYIDRRRLHQDDTALCSVA